MSAPYCGLADAMEFRSRSVVVQSPKHCRMTASEEPQFITGLRLFLLKDTLSYLIRVPVNMETAPMVPDNLRRRVEIPRRPIVQHARIIRNTHHEPVRQAARLESRISDIERLVRFLIDMMLGVISAFFAVVGAAFLMAVLIGSTRSAQACWRF